MGSIRIKSNVLATISGDMVDSEGVSARWRYGLSHRILIDSKLRHGDAVLSDEMMVSAYMMIFVTY